MPGRGSDEKASIHGGSDSGSTLESHLLNLAILGPREIGTTTLSRLNNHILGVWFWSTGIILLQGFDFDRTIILARDETKRALQPRFQSFYNQVLTVEALRADEAADDYQLHTLRTHKHFQLALRAACTYEERPAQYAQVHNSPTSHSLGVKRSRSTTTSHHDFMALGRRVVEYEVPLDSESSAGTE